MRSLALIAMLTRRSYPQSTSVQISPAVSVQFTRAAYTQPHAAGNRTGHGASDDVLKGFE